ncbi:hypothetical protein ACJVC5_01155 [Peredibacter sp. HCB2-198]|uniref:hypothetical protein n=1 Tax=Peredibacter sp. HCB2-198 TaxID=3383025 RepID=UPI0038B49B85
MKILFACCFLLSSGVLMAASDLVSCKGGEKSGMSERWCESDQWLVTLENEGPFIAKIKETHTHSINQYYEIIPQDNISSKQRRKIGQYLVKFDQSDIPVFEKRFPKGFIYDSADFEDSI